MPLNADGSGLTQITDDNYVSDPQWSPDGSELFFQSYYDSNYDSALYSIPASGGTQTEVAGPGEGFSEATSVALPPPGSWDQAYLAAQFEPLLMFDTTEKWRPLNVNMFLNETDPNTGAAWNQICDQVAEDGSGGETLQTQCSPLDGESSLLSYPASTSYISIHRDSSSDPDSYTSPNLACLEPNAFGVTLHDCDSGPASAIYWSVAGPSPGNYGYIEYWLFYRYNQGYEDIGNHAGDWEGVTVAPASDGTALAYVEYSHHGAWESYLPSGLTCGSETQVCSVEGNETTDPGATRVQDFPAAGSHSNWPTTFQSEDQQDGSNDGEIAWGNNYDDAALIAMPSTLGQSASEDDDWGLDPSASHWPDWPGAWGDTPNPGSPSGSPCGPAAPNFAANDSCGNDHAGHFYAPWSQSGSNTDCSESGDLCPNARRNSPASAVQTCTSWFGESVAIAACDQPEMQRALRTHGLSRRGSFRIVLVTPRRSAATAPGLAQLLGQPLRPGQRAVLSGVVPAGTQLLVRAQSGRKLTTATFQNMRRLSGRAVIRVEIGRHGTPEVVLQIGRRVVRPTVVSTETVRKLPARARRRLKTPRPANR